MEFLEEIIKLLYYTGAAEIKTPVGNKLIWYDSTKGELEYFNIYSNTNTTIKMDDDAIKKFYQELITEQILSKTTDYKSYYYYEVVYNSRFGSNATSSEMKKAANIFYYNVDAIINRLRSCSYHDGSYSEIKENIAKFYLDFNLKSSAVSEWSYEFMCADLDIDLSLLKVKMKEKPKLEKTSSNSDSNNKSSINEKEDNLLNIIVRNIYNTGGCAIFDSFNEKGFEILCDEDGSLIYVMEDTHDNKTSTFSGTRITNEDAIKELYRRIFSLLLMRNGMTDSSNVKVQIYGLQDRTNISQEARLKAINDLDFNFIGLTGSIIAKFDELKLNGGIKSSDVLKEVSKLAQNMTLFCNSKLDFSLEYIKNNLDFVLKNIIMYVGDAINDKNFKDENKDKYIIKDNNGNLRIVNAKQEPQKAINTSLLRNSDIAYEFIDEREFITNPAVGRESEIRKLGSILLTPSYSAMLIGEPGVGKTAIVEGLSYAIKNGLVSDRLKNTKILKVNVSSIVSGTMYVGSLEKKMEALIEFLKANKNVVLYMDEIHTIIGAGTGSKSNIDVANLLKPHIENGSIKVIGATTIGEYDKIMSNDPAFTRRFKQVSVDEPKKELLRGILDSNISKFEEETGIKFSSSESVRDKLIELIIELTNVKHYLEKRYNPALSLSIIEEAFGYAAYDMSEEVGVTYIKEAINDCESIYESQKAKVDRIDLSDEDSKCRIIELKSKNKKTF